MHPELSHGIPTYGVMVVFAFITGTIIVRRLSEKIGIDKEIATDMALLIIPLAFLLSRSIDLIIGWQYYFTSVKGIIDALSFWNGGFTYLGGFLSALLVIWFYRKKINILKLMDTSAPALAIGHSIGRLGCLFAGCCWGKRWEHGIILTKQSLAYKYFQSTGDVHPWMKGWGPVHPTQLYESLGNILIGIFLLSFFNKKRFNGHLAALYIIMYGTLRFFIEIFRGDPNRGFIIRTYTPNLAKLLSFGRFDPLFLSTSQGICIFLIIAGVFWLFLSKKFF